VRSSPALTAAIAIALSAASLLAQSPPGQPDQKAAAFTQRVLDAMGQRDVDALAAMFRFPATVQAGSLSIQIANRAALAKAYDTVFTPELGCAIERGNKSALQVQPAGDSFVITKVDEPAGAAPAAPRPQPRHVDVPSGQVQFAGTLAAGGADRYMIAARQGDVLQARIERFQGRALGVRVVDAKTSRTLSTGPAAARVVSAPMQQAGDVVVEVTRLTFCDPAVSYLLTISKRR
jgi:hypothetical protein